MITLDKKYKTKSGLPVRIYCTDGGGDFPVHGSFFMDGIWQIGWWSKEGYSNNTGLESEFMLVEEKERIERTYWVNIYKESDDEALSNISHGYTTKEVANAAHYIQLGHIKDDDRIACVQLTISCEKGDGLEEES